MNAQSISIKKATDQTNIYHNNREMNKGEKRRNSHIDWTRVQQNVTIFKRDIKTLYEEEFGPSVEAYNAKQKRNDRKIKDYYEKICNSSKTKVQQEMIVQIGTREDYQVRLFEEMDFENDQQWTEQSWTAAEEKRIAENWHRSNEILKEWCIEFPTRNPNLKIYNAVIHNDESSPHIHINFVPVATGYKRGMEKQVSFDKALIGQDKTLDKMQPFEAWRQKELNILEEKLKTRGVERKLVGTNEYKDLHTFKRRMALENNIKDLEVDFKIAKRGTKKAQEELGDVTEEIAEKREKLSKITLQMQQASQRVQQLEQQRLKREAYIKKLDKDIEQKIKDYQVKITEMRKKEKEKWEQEQADYKTKLKESQKLDETIAVKEKKVLEVNQLIADKTATLEKIEQEWLEKIPEQKETIPFLHYETVTNVKVKMFGKDEVHTSETNNIVLSPDQVKIVQDQIYAATRIKKDYEKLKNSDPIKEKEAVIQQRNQIAQEKNDISYKYKILKKQHKELQDANWRLAGHAEKLQLELESTYQGVKNFIEVYFKNPKNAMKEVMQHVKSKTQQLFKEKEVSNVPPTIFEKKQKELELQTKKQEIEEYNTDLER